MKREEEYIYVYMKLGRRYILGVWIIPRLYITRRQQHLQLSSTLFYIKITIIIKFPHLKSTHTAGGGSSGCKTTTQSLNPYIDWFNLRTKSMCSEREFLLPIHDNDKWHYYYYNTRISLCLRFTSNHPHSTHTHTYL